MAMTHPIPRGMSATQRRRHLHSRSVRQRGVVIVIAIISILMMAGMIAYLFNTGRHAQLKQETQNAADATAIGGAGFIARSFNTVAMNNVEISRLIAVVQMLDAMPLAVEYTMADQEATLDVTRGQLTRGTGQPWVREQLSLIQGDLAQQIQLLREMDNFFNRSGYDVREMTFYDGPAGRGELWKAMESLDTLNQSTVEYVNALSQVNAYEAGLDNMTGDDSRTVAFITPFRPQFDFRRGRFDDFRLPVVLGRLPDEVDDEVTNRGPYDTIFGWHAAQSEATEIPNPDAGNQQTTNRFGSQWSGGTGRGGRNIVVNRRVTSYTTFGTWQWLGDVLRRRVDVPGVLYNSQFITRVNRMAGNKLNYLWPGSAREWVFLDPQWITSYAEAEAIRDARTPRAAYTQFIRMDFEHVFINDVPQTSQPVQTDWTILRPRGARLEVPGLPKVRDHMWEDEATTVFTNPITNVETRIEYTRVFVWAGMNVGPQIEIRNPNNFASRNDLPSPIDFDHSTMFRPRDGEVGQPGQPFAILGVARQPNDAPMWSDLFNTSAYGHHVAVAQAGIFNNHSWDLWTQMWHAQLEPVNEYSRWVSLMQSTPGDADVFPQIDPNEVSDTVEYLDHVSELAEILMDH